MALKKTLFGNTIPPACAYCEHGRAAQNEVMVLCSINGPVSPSYKCRKYIYDPLKRIPKKQPKLPDYSPEDFIIG